MNNIRYLTVITLIAAMAIMSGCGKGDKTNSADYLNKTQKIQELKQQLEQKILVMDKKEFKRPPLFGSAVPGKSADSRGASQGLPLIGDNRGNAAEFYKEAEAKVEHLNATQVNQLKEVIDNPAGAINQEWLDYYNRNKSVIEIINKGVNSEFYKPLANFGIFEFFNQSTLDLFTSKFPDMHKVRATAYVMIMLGREQEKKHQAMEALKLYCNIIRFGQDCMRGGGLIDGKISSTISNDGQREIQRALRNNRLSDQDLAELIAAFKILFDFQPSWEDVYDRNRLLSETALKSADQASFPITEVIETWGNTIFYFGEEKRLESLPYSKVKDEWEALKTKVRAIPLNALNIGYTRVSFDGYWKWQARMQGAFILTALELYHSTHKSYPDNLAALSPEIVPQVPLDPYTGNSFIYKIDNNQKIHLYSVGENLMDDNGNEKDDIIISSAKVVESDVVSAGQAPESDLPAVAGDKNYALPNFTLTATIIEPKSAWAFFIIGNEEKICKVGDMLDKEWKIIQILSVKVVLQNTKGEKYDLMLKTSSSVAPIEREKQSFEGIAFATAVNADHSAKEAATTFKPSERRIYACFRNKGALQGLNLVNTRWINTTNGTIEYNESKSLDPNAPYNFVWVQKNGDWALGEYKVELIKPSTIEPIAIGLFIVAP